MFDARKVSTPRRNAIRVTADGDYDAYGRLVGDQASISPLNKPQSQAGYNLKSNIE